MLKETLNINKGISILIVIVTILTLAVIVGGTIYWLYQSGSFEDKPLFECQIDADCESKEYELSCSVDKITKKCIDSMCKIECEITKDEFPEIIDETDGWETYTDDGYGFEIKYPNDWGENKNILGAFEISKDFNNYKCSVEIYANKERYLYPFDSDQKSSRAYFQAYSDSAVWIRYENITIEDFSAIKIYAPDLPGKQILFFVRDLREDKYYFNIFLEAFNKDNPINSLAKDHQCGEVFNEIVSTFKFTEKESIEELDPICQYRKGEYEIRIYDSQGRMTGIKNGEIKEEIPGTSYIADSPFPTPGCIPPCQSIVGSAQVAREPYQFENFCKKDGNYKFSQFSSERNVNINIVDIPMTEGMTHRLDFDWDALERGEEGLAILIDIESDGVFDKVIPSDNELTCEEFVIQLKQR